MIKKNECLDRIDKATNDIELDVIFKEFMLSYLRLYRDTGNKEYLEMSKWISKKKLEIVDKIDTNLLFN
jgi:DUF1680 family protein